MNPNGKFILYSLRQIKYLLGTFLSG